MGKKMNLIGKMMDRPLLVSAILEHAADQFGQQEIVSLETHGPLHRYQFRAMAKRANKLANGFPIPKPPDLNRIENRISEFISL